MYEENLNFGLYSGVCHPLPFFSIMSACWAEDGLLGEPTPCAGTGSAQAHYVQRRGIWLYVLRRNGLFLVMKATEANDEVIDL